MTLPIRLLSLTLVLSTLTLTGCKQAYTIPGKIEAEDFHDFYDTTSGNTGTAYRETDVDIEATQDSGGGFNVGWIDTGEYLRYNINVSEAGTHRFRFRVATNVNDRYFSVRLNGATLIAQVSVPNTNGWQNWTDVDVNAELPAGAHQLELYFPVPEFNLNSIQITRVDASDPDDPPDANGHYHDAANGGKPVDMSRIQPLFTAGTPKNPALVFQRNGNIVTRVGDRVRDRHARESEFRAYQHYLPRYFENRTLGLEIEDSTSNGGNTITVRMSTPYPHENSNFRAFFRGINTVAEYFHNATFTDLGNNNYLHSFSYNTREARPIQAGDLIEIEVGVFLRQPVEGRFNYYASTYLYRAGQGGLIPWQGNGSRLDSVPMPSKARLGGGTTQPYNYSDEPQLYLMQMAYNLAPENAQLFVEGRRLHHTDFRDGSHSEPGNPVFSAQANKTGPLFSEARCVSCHTRNGRSLPTDAVQTPLHNMVFKVGSTNASGEHTSHPTLGGQLQTRALPGTSPEGSAVISHYETSNGQFHDGTPYSLRKPVYHIPSLGQGGRYSARIAPPLVGLGLLEAVDESTIKGLADPLDQNQDGISGRPNVVTDPVSGHQRLGRFGWKARQAAVDQQIGAALREDMGVGNSIFRDQNNAAELNAAELHKMAIYLQTLAVPPQRDSENATVRQGETLFMQAGCGSCHTPSLTTGSNHPLAELRNQTIQPYTDMLLHDMGAGLADNLADGAAGGSEWRTAPLWGIGLTQAVTGRQGYLHDGRARSLLEAILWHGGEGESSKQAVLAMSTSQRNALIRFLESL